MYCESLWNDVVIQQGVFNRLKITYYIATSMNNSKIHKVSNFRKNAKTYLQTAKTFRKLQIVNG